MLFFTFPQDFCAKKVEYKMFNLKVFSYSSDISTPFNLNTPDGQHTVASLNVTYLNP